MMIKRQQKHKQLIIDKNWTQHMYLKIARKMATSDLSSLRLKYKKRGEVFLEEHIAVKEPIGLFRKWLDEAIGNTDIIEPNAMCLSTASKTGVPSSRMVLLKGVTERGFTFFTNYGSHKAGELAENPFVALNFYWAPTNRQIRIEGTAEKLSTAESEEYFHQRPRASQIGALTSPQSQRIPNRGHLDEIERSIKEKYGPDKEIPLPNWGGYLVSPHTIEFWQGQSDRLHDRIQFRRGSQAESDVDDKLVHRGVDGWVYERLAP